MIEVLELPDREKSYNMISVDFVTQTTICSKKNVLQHNDFYNKCGSESFKKITNHLIKSLLVTQELTHDLLFEMVTRQLLFSYEYLKL